MNAVAEGLWTLADEQECRGEYGKAVKCLEAICQSNVSFLPMVEIKTRLRLAQMLIDHTNNLNHAKSHLERANLLLKSIPSCFDIKCRAHSLLSRCYNLTGAIHAQKLILQRALELIRTFSAMDSVDSSAARMWACNFYSQLSGASVIEGDYDGALSIIENGFRVASELRYPELQMYFATMELHVNLLQWKELGLVTNAVQTCNEVWESIPSDIQQTCVGLFFYNELLQTFYLLGVCDYKGASEHVDKLDAAMKSDLQLVQQIEELLAEYDTLKRNLSRTDLHSEEMQALSQKSGQIQEKLKVIIKSSSPIHGPLDDSFVEKTCRQWREKLHLAPPPIDGEWLPKRAVYVLVDLMAVMLGRPKGWFKDCGRRIQSGLDVIHEEIGKLGIDSSSTEASLKKSAIWIGGLYLTILMQFLENKIAVELTRSEFVEAREALVQMIDWFARFPTMLQGCECIIEMLRGQYAHSLGCLNEAVFHFTEAIKITESKSLQTMCQVYAAVSYICIGDAEASSQALDLVGPVYRMIDSFSGVREKTCIIFVYGLLLMKQQNLQESRIRLASGLKLAHQHLGNIQLVSQFLTILGALALQLHDTAQAREILKSALTLAKTLYDIPTQIWVLSVLTDLYKELGDRGNEMENAEYERKKEDDLQKRLSEAQSSIHHIELIEKSRVKVKLLPVGVASWGSGGPSTKADLDIPESVGLPNTTSSMASVTRLREVDSSKRGKRRV